MSNPTKQERTVQVEVESDPEVGMNFNRKALHRPNWEHARVVRVPQSTLARWEAAAADWEKARNEMYNYLVEAGGRGW